MKIAFKFRELFNVIGIIISFGLIVAIGSQNAWVLKQGLLKQHVFLVCSICFLGDLSLMTLGVFGVADLFSKNNHFSFGISAAGAIFLLFYSYKCFKAAYQASGALDTSIDGGSKISSTKMALITLGLTLLNPHVYIDTVVVIGGLSTGLAPEQRIYFLSGTVISSFFWFFSLGYLSRYLRPILKSKKSWQILDACIGLIMLFIAVNLIIFCNKQLPL